MPNPPPSPTTTCSTCASRASRDDLWPMLAQLLRRGIPDYAQFRADLERAMRGAWAERPAALKRLDLMRDLEPDWFQRPGMVGLCVLHRPVRRRPAGRARGRLDYLGRDGRDLHPFHALPAAARGRQTTAAIRLPITAPINPDLGTMADFEETVAAALRRAAMSVCIDMVLNHTAKEHAWAQKGPARAIRPISTTTSPFPTTRCRGPYEQTAHEVFPAHAPGNFHLLRRHRPLGLDLVQRAPVGSELGQSAGLPRDRPRSCCFLANKGVEVLRAGCGGVPVETDRHPLPVRSRNAT